MDIKNLARIPSAAVGLTVLPLVPDAHGGASDSESPDEHPTPAEHGHRHPGQLGGSVHQGLSHEGGGGSDPITAGVRNWHR